MRKRKIRGHRRRWKDIEKWRDYNLSIDLNSYLLTEPDNYYYAKIRVRPWSGISVRNSEIPPPRGKTKRLIVSALLDIYQDWKSQLDTIGQPYYLKIWLYEPRFSQSQAFCSS